MCDIKIFKRKKKHDNVNKTINLNIISLIT